MAYNNRYPSNELRLPAGYLEEGYFQKDEKDPAIKKLKAGLVLKTAEDIARTLGMARPQLNKNQLRKFYDYSINMQEKLRLCQRFSLIETDILKLISFAADAKSKGNIPQIFFDFIETNIKTIKNEDDFTKGFMEHFQAVVAYFSFLNPRAKE